MYSVYKHTAPNGKVYIGITKHRPEARWQREGRGYKKAGYFRFAIAKYGWDNIKHEIVATGLTAEEAAIAERKLIKRYDSRNFEHGYNIQVGGSLGWAGMHHSDEAKRKLSEAKVGEKNPMFGKHLSEEHRKKISEANKGRVLSEETKEKMRLAQGNRSEETRKRLSDAQKKRPVYCEELSKSFAGVSQAGKELNISPSNITACCKGRKRVAGGYHWRYVEQANTEVSA